MTDKMEIIRDECSNYYLYQQRIDEIEKEIEKLRYTMHGVHAVSYSTMHGQGDERDKRLAEWLDKQENLINMKQEYKRKVKMIENWMNQVESSVRFYVWMYCVEGMGIAQMAEQSGIHESSVFRMVRKGIQRICI
ncbi:MAG: hypothetical protein IKR11_03480 [Solobacterium sp.]|nr:hypothetical protein [Solobacterium sp.]